MKVNSGFDQINRDVDFVVDNLNDSLNKDETLKKSRKAIGVSCFQIVIGIAGLGAVSGLVTNAINAEVLTQIQETGASLSNYFSPDLTEKIAEVSQQAKEVKDEKRGISSVASLDSSTHKSSTDFLRLIKNQTIKQLDDAETAVKQTSLPDWDGALKKANEEVLLSSTNPGDVGGMVRDVKDKMSELVIVERNKAVQTKLDELPPGIKKIIASTTITEADALDEGMGPIKEFLHLRFIANNLASRDYNNPANQAYGYESVTATSPIALSSPTAALPAQDNHQLMTRVGKFRYFPDEFSTHNKLLMLSKPYVRTSKVSVETMHKGGDNIRKTLVTNISGIRENQELYGFKNDGSGKVASKGKLEDTLRSYAIIGELMQNLGHTSTVPFLKSEAELTEVIKDLMKFNVFYETHNDNKGPILITPLSVFNRDPHLKNLISSNPLLKDQLHTLMTENDSNFILKCLTDPNINKSNHVAYKEKLEANLGEIFKLYTECGASDAESEAILEKGMQYIELQCSVKGSLAASCSDNSAKILPFLPNNHASKALLQKIAQAETMPLAELESTIQALEAQSASIQPLLNPTKESGALTALIQSSKKMLQDRKALEQFDPYANLAVTAITTPASPTSVAPVSPTSVAPSASAVVTPAVSSTPGNNSPTHQAPPPPPASSHSSSPSSRAAPPPPTSSSTRPAPPPPSPGASPASPEAGRNVTAEFKRRVPKPPEPASPSSNTTPEFKP